MPQSLSRVLVHLVFSTKNREPFIAADVRPRLHGYIVGILDHMKCPSIQTGGVAGPRKLFSVKVASDFC